MQLVEHKMNALGKSVLIIGDTHLPYHHSDYLDFIKAVSKKFNCKIHIHIGDEIDGHAWSFHDSDQELFSAGHELELAIEQLEPWVKAFPDLKLLESNHGSLLSRRLKHHGIPIRSLKPLSELYNAKKWQWFDDILLKTKLGDVYLCHGKASPYGKLCKEMSRSCVQGHFHNKLEITWHDSIETSRFNMFVGCGINWKSRAFDYGKNNAPKPILGCGVIDQNGLPLVVKMICDSKCRWIVKI